MPKIVIPFDIDIPPEKYLRNCSNTELRELDILLQSPYYQVRMYGTHTPEAKENFKPKPLPEPVAELVEAVEGEGNKIK